MNLTFFMRKPVTTTWSPVGSVHAPGIMLLMLLFSQWLYAAPSRVIPSGYIVVFHDDVDTNAAANELKARFNIMAPGRNIRSTVPGGGLANKSGTSMAAAHVAGAAALYLLQHPGASPATVKTALLASGDMTPST